MKTETMVSYYILMALVMILSNLTLGKLLNKQIKTSFECGFKNLLAKKSAFSTNFLLLIMMFLIFDIEISFLIPLIIMNKSQMLTNIAIVSSFLALLTIILLKEWKQGSLEWNK